MTDRHLIVVDIETTGLDPRRHSVVEVAWWNLATDDRGRFIPPHNPGTVLASAEIEALRTNRYIDRIPGQPQDTRGDGLIQLWHQFSDWDEQPDGSATRIRHTLVGCNPAFDASFLQVLFGNYEVTEDDQTPWHHRMWDVSAYAAGVLWLAELPGLAALCDLLDVPPPDHTAEGDVTATGLCFRALRERAATNFFRPTAIEDAS